ncbi:sodium-dependent transporter [Bacillota bacterium LX-D]|nr:sodium-dependent transporter [Bacillota bacterium LX-D]
MQNNAEKRKHNLGRDKFVTSLGVIAATLGSAIGLGNIWKFPFLAGQNGGAAFILIYLICLILVGLPLLLSELIIGRTTNANPVGAFKKLAPRTPWFLTGLTGCISAFLIMAFYSNVAGWVYAYIFKAASRVLSTTKPEITGSVFNTFVSGVGEPLFWQFMVLLVTSCIILAGVSNGIERVTKILMPILFFLLIISDLRALTLPNAWEGVKFLFQPDFSKITGAVVLTALGLSFFKLSIGIGTMVTYGSYISKKENLVSTAAKVALSDTLVSILAGLAIFPAVFAFGFQPDAGASLLFITIPTVFSSMPLGNVFMVLFFILSAIAATTAITSMFEVPVAYFTEEFKLSRPKAVLLTLGALMLVGSTATLSFSVLSDFKLFGKTMFDLFDYTTSNILMPLAGLATAVFLAWKWGFKNIAQEASNNGKIQNIRLLRIITLILKYITPVAIILVLLSGLNFLNPILKLLHLY